jgi:glycosyltransferase involved in cell wall biosynthesis
MTAADERTAADRGAPAQAAGAGPGAAGGRAGDGARGSAPDGTADAAPEGAPDGAAGWASDWRVPAFAATLFRPRRARHACVVPVINEGDRIRRQLAAMRAEGCMEQCDVILADGGSTDGSADPAALAAQDLRALLVKTGPGKLSAQLRMAYAWALAEGYEGVVTIDGNGKDGPEGVARFVAALDRGVDYAQASRFAPGGSAVNTPWLRDLAIRLIHAPVCSLAGGVRLTDTTQGFRAYSRRYLLDPRVQPFRDVFDSYELLAYLTIRAGQLGFAVEEVPTRRVYPKGEPIPTKISLVGGNLRVLRILVAAALGRYAPGR